MSREEVKTFKRELGLIGGISLAAGSTIGSGIFITPTGVLAATGSVGCSLIMWTVCAVYTVLCGMCYLEVSLLIRESGGTYSYWYHCYGRIPAFMVCWFWSAMDGPSGAAIVSITFAQYIAAPFFPGCVGSSFLLKFLAFSIIMALTAMNSISVKASKYLQVITMVGKVVVLSVIAFFGLYNVAIGKTAGLENAFEGSSTKVSSYAIAFYTCMWSYGGWERVCQCFDEIKNPKRNMPIIIAVSIALTGIIYLAVNVAYFTVMTKEEMLASSAVAYTFANRVFPDYAWIVPLGVCLSTLGSLNGILYAYSRIPFVGARNKQLPKHFNLISETRNTPIIGSIWICLISCVMLIPKSEDFFYIIDFATPFSYISASGLFISIFVFRYKRKDERLFKCPLIIPAITLVVTVMSILLPIIVQPNWAYFYAALTVLAGYLFYLPFFEYGYSLPFSDKIYTCLQLYFEAVPEVYKND